MSSHHTKDKGDLGVLKAQVDLFEQGFAIFTPQTEHCPFDLVAYKDGEFRREIWLECVTEGKSTQE